MTRNGGTPPKPDKAVRPRYLVDQVIEALQDSITSGEYKLGERLPAEAKLAAEFGVGRSTIREALRVLSHLGKVETRTGSGSIVVDHRAVEPHIETGMTLDEMADIYRFRYSVEVSAAEMAAQLRTPRQLKRIKALLAQAKSHIDRQDVHGATTVDTDLHIAILEAGQFHFAADVYRANRTRLEQALRLFIAQMAPLVPNSSVHAVQRLHDDLVDAIERGDGKAAARLVKRDAKEVGIGVALARRRTG